MVQLEARKVSGTDRYTDTNLALSDEQLFQEWCQELGTENITSSPLRVAGTSFRQIDVKLCRIGDKIRLVPEPKNRFDQHAVKVMVMIPLGRTREFAFTEEKRKKLKQFHVGYVPKECCLTVKYHISRSDYKGCRIAKMDKPKGSPHIGIQLALLFGKDPPDLYAPL